MLVVDGQPVQLLPKDSLARQEYDSLMRQLINDFGDVNIVIKTKRDRIVYDNGYIEMPNFVYLPTKTTHSPKGSLYPMEWRWYANASDARNPSTPAKYLFDKEVIYIDKNNRDFAIFLIYMLKYESGAPFYGSAYEVFSSKKADTAIADNYRTLADLNFYIFGNNSEVSKDIKLLIKIGKALGMENFSYDEKYMNNDTVRNKLYEYVKEGEELGIQGRNIDAFIRAIQAYVDTDIRAFVQDAFDKGVLYKDENNTVFIVEGKKQDLLMQVGDVAPNEYITSISNYLKGAESQRKRLEDIMGTSAYTGGDYEWNDIKMMSHKGLVSICNQLKIKKPREATSEELRNLICTTLGIQQGE